MTSRSAPPSLRSHQAQRLEHAVDLIDRCLAGDLSLDRLARSAAFSPFHFQRIFRALTGESPGDFLRRRRLETAASRLRYCPGERIVDVSLQCGFGTSQAFARSFRQHFKMSPTQWRGPMDKEGPVGPGRPHLAVVVRHREPFDVVYQRERGDYRHSTIPLWQRAEPWIEHLSLSLQPRLSMGLDDPTITSPDRCRLDACVVVPPGWADTGNRVLRRTIRGGSYAVHRYVGPAATLQDGWAVLLKEWLPAAGFTLADGPFFARHVPGISSPDGHMLDCELHMPVRSAHR